MRPIPSSAALVRANAVALPLADASVDLIVTSPPYWSHRDYGEAGQIGLEDRWSDFLQALWAVTAECARVLKPSGSLWVNLGDRMAGSGGYNNASIDSDGRGPKQYTKMGKRTDRADLDAKRGLVCHQPAWADFEDVPHQSRTLIPQRYVIGCVDRLGLLCRAPVIWWKNAIPQNAADRVEFRHEDVWHLAKQSPCYSNPEVMKGWESVWRIPTEPLSVPQDLGVRHFAPFPQELVRRIVLGWAPENGVVLDPFAGTGTVPMVARALGRFGIGVDLSADYLRLARWRVFQSGHARKSIARTAREAQQEMAL